MGKSIQVARSSASNRPASQKQWKILCGAITAAIGQPLMTSSSLAQDTAPTTRPASQAAAETAPATATPVRAAGDGAPQSFLIGEPIVVTATRLPEAPLKSPYAVDVVGQQQIAERGYRTPTEAVAEVPGVMAQKTGPGQGSPFIRGFTGFRTLLLVDGIRLNNSTFRDGPNQYFNTIDALGVDRFEIVKGPASVLYGSDAIGGTINSITKGPTGYGDGTRFGAALYQRAASAEKSYTIHPEGTVTFGQKVGVYAAGSYKKYGDLEGGKDIGEQDATSYDEWSGDLKVEYNLTPNQRLVFAHQRYQQNNAPRTHSTVDGINFAGSTNGSDLQRDLDQYRDLTYVQYHADQLTGAISNVMASVSWHHQFESEDRIRGNGARSISETDVGSLGLLLQLTSPTPIGELTYGVEYYRDSVSSSSSTNPIQGPVGDNANYDLLGLYIQDRIPIGDRFDLTLGGRFTYAAADIGSYVDPTTGDAASLEQDWTSFVGSIRGNYFIVKDQLSAFAGVSQGFRAPNLSDLSRLDIARSGELEIAAPGLDPEEFVSYEIGFKGAWDNWGFQAAYFYTDINDMIVRRPTGATIGSSAVVTKANAGDGYIQGIELGLSYRFHPDFTFFGAGSWQDGEIDQFPTSGPQVDREPASRLIPTNGLLGIRWDDPSRRVFVEGAVQIVAAQHQLSSGDKADTQRIPPGGTPSYELYHLRAGWTINPNATLTLACENLFDEDYRVHGSGSNGAGRNFVVGLELRY
ncbi:TonB-dependent receptor [Humisphaera borealis]|uniref:TonB-dependent receptor n=1 Tax=Humisphaera borealis TaxID=2807512 RepID=A0A7M2WRS8_9BACT|nr:TonB-dependent receptor [Humisphaera borealis]QOV87511.1 TonB-dependent receptor [Humisphaera borealis]